MTARFLANAQDQATNIKCWTDFVKTANTQSQWLYMLIDAAHDCRILPALENSKHARCCLFNEEQVSRAVKNVSPFLIKIKSIDDFMMWCLQEGLHRHWMIFFTSPEVHVSELKLHFKRFSLAYSPDGRRYFFRYYDPRVLPVFLASSDLRERTDFFRRCTKIWVPQISSSGCIQFLQLDATGATQILDNPLQTFATRELQ